MLRGTPGHAKTAALAAYLNVPIYAAVGLLEMLWHFTAQSARQGDVGKWPDGALAAACRWDRDPAELIEGFVTAGYLDRSAEYRLVVHDWHDHADKSVRQALARFGQGFVTGGSRNVSRHEPTIYILADEATGRFKIGFTEGSLAQRIEALQTGNPNPLKLLAYFPGTRTDEANLHARFAAARIAGEWFLPTPDLVAFVGAVKDTAKPLRGKNLPRTGSARLPRGARAAPDHSAQASSLKLPPEPVPEPEPVPGPEPVPAYDDERAGARPSPAPPPPALPAFAADSLLQAATSRFARLVVQLEAIDPHLAGELETEAEEAARTPAEFDALSDRALERLTQPDPPSTPTAGATAPAAAPAEVTP